MALLDNLIRPNIRELSPYTSAREQFLDYGLTLLDANENPHGPIGLQANPYSLHRYPDPYQRTVKNKLATIWGHPAQGIVLGNGSDEIIDLLIRIFCEPGKDEILITAPTYGMYKVAAHINDVAVTEVSLTNTFDLDAVKLLQKVGANTKIIFLCSPNNPTGNLLSGNEIVSVLSGFDGVVVLDEAYIDFAEEQSFVSKITQFPRLVVSQTFSKAWGLAGIRLGVCFSSLEIAHYLNRVKPPYNVNQLTQQQALLALDAREDLAKLVQQVRIGRELLSEQLQQLDMVEVVYPSQTNFVLVKVKHPEQVFEYLIEHQIVVRNRSKVHLCQGCLRITIGSALENHKLLDALKGFES